MHRLHVSAVAFMLAIIGSCRPADAPEPRQVAIPTHDTAITGAAACSDPSEWLVRDSTVGPIHVGAPADSVLTLCPGTLDSIMHDRNMDWVDTTRMLLVPVGTRDTVRVTIDRHNQKVDAIVVRTGQFRTVDSLGIGASITRWRSIPGVRVDYGDHTDDGVLVVPSHCGLGFGISGGGYAPDDRVADAEDLATWPDSVRITSISVYRCSRN